MEIRTNKEVTKKAFLLWFNTYLVGLTHAEVTAELKLILQNCADRYYNDFMNSRRTKAHSAAFYSVILAIKAYMPKGYYASNPQMKANISEIFGMDFKEFLAPLTRLLEKEREENLHYKKGKKK